MWISPILKGVYKLLSELKEILHLQQAPGRTALAGGREFLFFSGYSYLGMNFVPQFVSLLQEGIQKFGWLYPSSRVSNTQLAVYEECEAQLAAFTGTENTVLFPSGFAAGRAVMKSKGPGIFNAPDAHPAIRGVKTSFNDFESWSRWFVMTADHDEAIRGLASDAINPLTADVYDFSFLTKVGKKIAVILDDSHGIGIMGASGKGVSARLPMVSGEDYSICYSLSKAFGIGAGAVSCSQEDARQLRCLPEYTAASPPLPAQIYAFIKSGELYAMQREKLISNIRYFADCVKEISGIHYHDGFPVFVLPPDTDEGQLYASNIIISSFAYPDPQGVKLKRVVLNALHTKSDLDYLASCLYKSCKSFL